MCNIVVNTCPSTIQLFPEYCKTKKMCDKAVNTCFLHLILFLINIRLKDCVTELIPKIPLC